MKRALDVALTLLFLPIWAPVLLALMALVRLQLGAPVFFKQRRPGLHGRVFELLRLRTMTDARDASGRLLADDQRLTRFGKWLRSTSLDELPELINVLQGEMSLVGPRPLLVQYLDRYSQAQARRHEVPPGITGWAQVNGRNAIAWEQKFDLDVWYVDHRTFWLDCKILLLTLKQVWRREGISAQGQATMPEFMGSNAEQAAKVRKNT
jgi:lipopolysaccharide/colanic/teichoic acid biosynthesis glycosyltransferase